MRAANDRGQWTLITDQEVWASTVVISTKVAESGSESHHSEGETQIKAEVEDCCRRLFLHCKSLGAGILFDTGH